MKTWFRTVSQKNGKFALRAYSTFYAALVMNDHQQVPKDAIEHKSHSWWWCSWFPSQNLLFRGGESKAVWKFFENSSVLEEVGIPKPPRFSIQFQNHFKGRLLHPSKQTPTQTERANEKRGDQLNWLDNNSLWTDFNLALFLDITLEFGWGIYLSDKQICVVLFNSFI